MPARRADARPDWGGLQPRQGCPWEEAERTVTLLPPRFGRGRLAAFLRRWVRSGPYRVRLDEFGGFVWRRLDGTKTVAEIAAEMRAEFGERAEPVAERLTQFLRHLERNRFIRIGGASGPRIAPPRPGPGTSETGD